MRKHNYWLSLEFLHDLNIGMFFLRDNPILIVYVMIVYVSEH